MCAGIREDGTEISPNDPIWDELHAAATAARDDPLAWISNSSLYGDLVHDTCVVTEFVSWLPEIWKNGSRAAIKKYLSLETGAH